MSVWVCVPSARPVAEVERWCERWHAQGYKIALFRDGEGSSADLEIRSANCVIYGKYPGYARAVNALAQHMLRADPDCDWIVCGGDDTWPDPNKRADEIAESCNWHFGSRRSAVISGDCDPMGYHPQTHTFGVMQPTGDDWSDDQGRIIERIAGSPWMGREWCLRINQGKGPLWPEYHHNWLDEELQLVAQKLGVFWQRPDLTQYHDHPLRFPGGQWPAHLLAASADYSRMKPVFEKRKAAGFPGSEPL